MSTKENKEYCQKLIEEFNAIRGDLSRLNTWIDKTFAPEVTQHSAGLGDMNYEQTKQMYTDLITAFNPVGTMKHLIAEDDLVVWHFNWSGTHRGTFMGIPATGKQVDVGVILITKIGGGKCEEVWSYQDNVGLMRQLGALPSPATVK
jgi:hypothetical protein